MTTLELPGRITESGQLEIELPAGLPAGEVMVRIEVPAEVLPSAVDWEHRPWTEEEYRELKGLMTPNPKTGAEIAAWLEANPPIDPGWGGITNDEDVADYVHNMRRAKHLDWGRDE